MGKAGRFGKYGDNKRMERLRRKDFKKLMPKDSVRETYKSTPFKGRERFRGAADVEICQAILTDIYFIKDLSREVFSIYGDYDVILQDLFLKRDVQTFLIYKERRPLGFAMLYPASEAQEEIAKAELLAIAVVPKYQGRHLGIKLLREAEALARKIGSQEIHLHVAEGNKKARSFFERYGFKVIGRCYRYYPKGQGAVEMLKRL